MESVSNKNIMGLNLIHLGVVTVVEKSSNFLLGLNSDPSLLQSP